MDVVGLMRCGTTLSVANAVTFRSTLDVSGATRIWSSLSVHDTLDVSGAVRARSTLSVSENAWFKKSVDVCGSLIGWSTLSVGTESYLTGAVQINNTLSVVSSVWFRSTVDVSGAVKIANSLSMSGTADIDGAVRLKTTLSVNGDTTIVGLTRITNNLSVNGRVDICGVTVLTNTLSVGLGADIVGATRIGQTLSVSNATTLSNTLSVQGSAWLNNTLDVTSATTLRNTLSVTSSAWLRGGVDVTGSAIFQNNLSVVQNAQINGSLSVGDRLFVRAGTTEVFEINNSSTANQKMTWNGSSLALGSSTAVTEASARVNKLSTDGNTYNGNVPWANITSRALFFMAAMSDETTPLFPDNAVPALTFYIPQKIVITKLVFTLNTVVAGTLYIRLQVAGKTDRDFNISTNTSTFVYDQGSLEATHGELVYGTSMKFIVRTETTSGSSSFTGLKMILLHELRN
jgi:acyl-[acyl carrier protein]--UDP-N-acetylglucosamine O-acyltransferase